jgi:hypothetical protein
MEQMLTHGYLEEVSLFVIHPDGPARTHAPSIWVTTVVR